MSAIDANCKYFVLLLQQLIGKAGASLVRATRAKARGKRIAKVAGKETMVEMLCSRLAT